MCEWTQKMCCNKYRQIQNFENRGVGAATGLAGVAIPPASPSTSLLPLKWTEHSTGREQVHRNLCLTNDSSAPALWLAGNASRDWEGWGTLPLLLLPLILAEPGSLWSCYFISDWREAGALLHLFPGQLGTAAAVGGSPLPAPRGINGKGERGNGKGGAAEHGQCAEQGNSYLIWGFEDPGCCSCGMFWILQGIQASGAVENQSHWSTLWKGRCNHTTPVWSCPW